VILAPDGSATQQLQHIVSQAREIQRKLCNSSLSQKNKWIALSSIIEPSLSYPLVATYFTLTDIKPYQSIMSTVQCNALSLNSHFSRALLHGSLMLGGMGIPTQTHKTTKDRLNYFLYNVRRPSIAWDKLEASIIFTQLEAGFSKLFFQCPYSQFGHLATISFAVQIWSECEPFGIKLQADRSTVWTPAPVLTNAIFIMDIATKYYNKKGSNMINRCRLFLQILSLADMLMYDLQTIHPSYRHGERPPSCQSNIYWPSFDNPPKHYWKLWSHFIRFYVDPVIASSTFSWHANPVIRHKIILFKHRHFFHIYRVADRDVTEFRRAPPIRGRRTPS